MSKVSHVYRVWVGFGNAARKAMGSFVRKDGWVVCNEKMFPDGVCAGDTLIIYFVGNYAKLPSWPKIQERISELQARGISVTRVDWF